MYICRYMYMYGYVYIYIYMCVNVFAAQATFSWRCMSMLPTCALVLWGDLIFEVPHVECCSPHTFSPHRMPSPWATYRRAKLAFTYQYIKCAIKRIVLTARIRHPMTGKRMGGKKFCVGDFEIQVPAQDAFFKSHPHRMPVFPYPWGRQRRFNSPYRMIFWSVPPHTI